MTNFNPEQLQPLLFLATGIGVIIFLALKKNASDALKLTREKAEGKRWADNCKLSICDAVRHFANAGLMFLNAFHHHQLNRYP